MSGRAALVEGEGQEGLRAELRAGLGRSSRGLGAPASQGCGGLAVPISVGTLTQATFSTSAFPRDFVPSK